MITKNFKHILAMTMQSAAQYYGSLPVQGVNGKMYYLCQAFDRFPYSRTNDIVNSATSAGISIGRSTVAENENDYNLGQTITSGVSITVTGRSVGCDAPGDPYLQYNLTVTNTGSSTLTIGEVGYKQTIRAATGPTRTSYADVVVLIDRTVLDTPISIAPGDAGVIHYKLKTTMGVPKKEGVDLVSWTWGTDEQVAEMIDAAQSGLIDLHDDAGWRVGDLRKVYIEGFTDPAGVVHAAQYIDLAISSFSDYNSCGCVIQFDFYEGLAVTRRINNTASTAGGYGNMEICRDTLPALVEHMPSWIKTRLLNFDVLAWDVSTGTLLTVSDNKLALRARVEILGTNSSNTDGEGTQTDLYKISAHRYKPQGYSGNNAVYWTRTPYNASNNYMINTSAALDYANVNTSARVVAPFGCM